jgi:hypothetical protein
MLVGIITTFTSANTRIGSTTTRTRLAIMSENRSDKGDWASEAEGRDGKLEVEAKSA